jgi:hypothetical protein
MGSRAGLNAEMKRYPAAARNLTIVVFGNCLFLGVPVQLLAIMICTQPMRDSILGPKAFGFVL